MQCSIEVSSRNIECGNLQIVQCCMAKNVADHCSIVNWRCDTAIVFGFLRKATCHKAGFVLILRSIHLQLDGENPPAVNNSVGWWQISDYWFENIMVLECFHFICNCLLPAITVFCGNSFPVVAWSRNCIQDRVHRAVCLFLLASMTTRSGGTLSPDRLPVHINRLFITVPVSSRNPFDSLR